MSDNNVSSDGTEENSVTNPVDTSVDNDVNKPSKQGENSSDSDVNKPSNEATTDNDSLNFDEIVKVPSTKEERGGKSRREWKKDNSDSTNDNNDNDDENLTDEQKLEERILGRMREENADTLKAIDEHKKSVKKDQRKDMEDTFTNTLKDKGISIKDFNEKHNKEFEKKRDQYLERNMSPEDAVMTALDVVTAKYESNQQIEESENRTDGRKKARLSPQSTVRTEKPTYTRADLANTKTQVEYNNIMDRVEKGEAKIV